MRSFNTVLTVLALSFASITAVGCAAGGDEASELDDADKIAKLAQFHRKPSGLHAVTA